MQPEPGSTAAPATETQREALRRLDDLVEQGGRLADRGLELQRKLENNGFSGPHPLPAER